MSFWLAPLPDSDIVGTACESLMPPPTMMSTSESAPVQVHMTSPTFCTMVAGVPHGGLLTASSSCDATTTL